jgi:hypothetical protein
VEIAVRAYTKPIKVKRKRKSPYEPEHSTSDSNRVFVFDTETRVDDNQPQTLLFGSFAVYNGEVLEQIGLFYDPDVVTAQELGILKTYCVKEPLVKLYTLKEFIEQAFYPMVYESEVLCCAFNLPFDLSRLANSWSPARKSMKGGFTFKLSDEAKHPPIIIKQNGNNEAFIHFQSTSYSHRSGHFVDCQRIAAILTDQKHISLKTACKKYNKVHYKIEDAEHGKITEEYIRYNIEDTLATAELFRHLKDEYEGYGIYLPLTDVYSSASIGKAALAQLGIKPFRELNPDFPSDILGKVMQAYSGGRCEDRIRKEPTRVSILDFSSMYPTLFILLGLYDYLIAERIDYVDATNDVQKFLEDVTIEDLQKPETWKRMNVIVEVEPEEDLVSVRTKYDGQNNTVGLNYLTAKEPVWFGLASLVNSKLQTGKVPKIRRAIRFVPVGKQKTLRKYAILGTEIDPSKDNLFKLLVEEKEHLKKLGDSRHRAIKILVNASSYGIFIELSREEQEVDMKVYSGNDSFPDHKKLEKEGKYFNPIIGAMITDGAKLLLGIGDIILQKHGAVMAYNDTDSMFIPPEYKDEIIKFYDKLNPYQNITHLLKVEEENVLFYGISAKRYVLYSIDEKGDFAINDEEHDEGYSLHGLGHLLNPFGKDETHWQKQIWLDILRLHYKKITEDDFLNKYRNYYAISQFTVSTKTLMDRFAALNKGKSYKESIKPFNFFLIGFGNNDEVKPIAQFSKDPQTMPYSEFIDYKTGKRMKGLHYFKSLGDEIWDYLNHPEAKLEGDIGILQRRHITADKIRHIGKEADKIEENLSGLDNVNYNIYTNPKDIEKIVSRTWNQVRQCGIPESQFYALKKQLKQGKTLKLHRKTAQRLNNLR